MRLARFAYRTEMISLPTFEAGPERWSEWLPQRTRWFKGWMQTWLVHMREPMTLARQLGFGSFVIAQIMFAGMAASALFHPFLVVTAFLLAFELSADGTMSTWRSNMLIFDVITIACGYISFLLLGWQTLAKAERRNFWRIVLYTPVYWMMISLAAWRAVWQLWSRPHHWEKTPHRKQPAVSLHRPEGILAPRR
jgi:cellulose synthase/poly-beta-1,6-N-acetylglucosamine synthase-like glycosyltransferase